MLTLVASGSSPSASQAASKETGEGPLPASQRRVSFRSRSYRRPTVNKQQMASASNAIISRRSPQKNLARRAPS